LGTFHTGIKAPKPHQKFTCEIPSLTNVTFSYNPKKCKTDRQITFLDTRSAELAKKKKKKKERKKEKGNSPSSKTYLETI